MSFQSQLGEIIAGAKTFQQFDDAARLIWKSHAAGLLDDDTAQAAAEALQAKKRATTDNPRPPTRKPIVRFPKRTAPRSPDRQKSIARRRSCATSGAVPSKIASGYTLGEIAVLSIVAAEVKRRGRCELCIDLIAARAGTCRRLAQLALRHAAEEGLISIEERPRPGQKSMTNIVTITSPEWRAWLRLGDRVQKNASHGNHLSNNLAASRSPTAKRLGDGGSGESPPLRPGPRGPIERHDRLAAALAKAETLLEGKVRARIA